MVIDPPPIVHWSKMSYILVSRTNEESLLTRLRAWLVQCGSVGATRDSLRQRFRCTAKELDNALDNLRQHKDCFSETIVRGSVGRPSYQYRYVTPTTATNQDVRGGGRCVWCASPLPSPAYGEWYCSRACGVAAVSVSPASKALAPHGDLPGAVSHHWLSVAVGRVLSELAQRGLFLCLGPTYSLCAILYPDGRAQGLRILSEAVPAPAGWQGVIARVFPSGRVALEGLLPTDAPASESHDIPSGIHA